MNEYLSAELNTVYNLPIIAWLWLCEDMPEELHPEFAGKCALTTFMDKCYHTVVTIHDP